MACKGSKPYIHTYTQSQQAAMVQNCFLQLQLAHHLIEIKFMWFCQRRKALADRNVRRIVEKRCRRARDCRVCCWRSVCVSLFTLRQLHRMDGCEHCRRFRIYSNWFSVYALSPLKFTGKMLRKKVTWITSYACILYYHSSVLALSLCALNGLLICLSLGWCWMCFVYITVPYISKYLISLYSICMRKCI